MKPSHIFPTTQWGLLVATILFLSALTAAAYAAPV